MRNNIEALNEALEKKDRKFELGFEPVKSTECFQDILNKKWIE